MLPDWVDSVQVVSIPRKGAQATIQGFLASNTLDCAGVYKPYLVSIIPKNQTMLSKFVLCPQCFLDQQISNIRTADRETGFLDYCNLCSKSTKITYLPTTCLGAAYLCTSCTHFSYQALSLARWSAMNNTPPGESVEEFQQAIKDWEPPINLFMPSMSKEEKLFLLDKFVNEMDIKYSLDGVTGVRITPVRYDEDDDDDYYDD
jgi:hypothetical protein